MIRKRKTLLIGILFSLFFSLVSSKPSQAQSEVAWFTVSVQDDIVTTESGWTINGNVVIDIYASRGEATPLFSIEEIVTDEGQLFDFREHDIDIDFGNYIIVTDVIGGFQKEQELDFISIDAIDIAEQKVFGQAETLFDVRVAINSAGETPLEEVVTFTDSSHWELDFSSLGITCGITVDAFIVDADNDENNILSGPSLNTPCVGEDAWFLISHIGNFISLWGDWVIGDVIHIRIYESIEDQSDDLNWEDFAISSGEGSHFDYNPKTHPIEPGNYVIIDQLNIDDADDFSAANISFTKKSVVQYVEITSVEEGIIFGNADESNMSGDGGLYSGVWVSIITENGDAGDLDVFDWSPVEGWQFDFRPYGECLFSVGASVSNEDGESFVYHEGPGCPAISSAALEAPNDSSPNFEALAGIPSPKDISTEPEILLQSSLLAVGGVFLFGLTATIFGNILSEYESQINKDIRGIFGRKAPPPKRKLSKSSLHHIVLGTIVFVLLTAFFESLLERPEAFFGPAHLQVFWTAVIAAFLILILEIVPGWIVTYRNKQSAKIDVKTTWIGIGIVAASTLLSLAVDFRPGFLFGLLGALVIEGQVSKEVEGRRALIVFAVIFIGAHIIWYFSPIFTADLEEMAKMVWFAGLQATLFGVLPILAQGEGRKLWNWNKFTSSVFILISFFAFIHFLLQPGYDSSIELFQQNSLVALGILGLVFIVSTLAIWWRYPYRLNRKTSVQRTRITTVTATSSRKYISFAVLGTSTILLALGIIGSTTLQNLRDARTWQDVAQNELITKENMSILVSKLFDENEEEIIDNIGFGQTLFDAYKKLDEEDLGSLSELTLPVGEMQDILLPLVSSYTDWLFFNSSDTPSSLSLSSIKQNLFGKTPQIASLLLNSLSSCTVIEAEILQELVNPIQPSIDTNVTLSFPLLSVYGMKLTNPNLYTEFVIEKLNVTIVDREIDMQTFSLRPPCGAFVGRTLTPSSEVTCYFSSVTNQIGQVNETLEFDTLFVPVDSAEDVKLCRINNSNDDDVYSFFEPKIGNMMGLIADRLPDEVSVEQISNDAQLESTLQTVSTLIRYQPYIWILAISMLLGGSYLLAGLSDVALRAAGFSVIFASILAGISAKLLPSYARDAAETIAQTISTSETEYTELILAIVEAITQTISADAIRLSFYLLGVGLILVVTSTLLTTAKNS